MRRLISPSLKLSDESRGTDGIVGTDSCDKGFVQIIAQGFAREASRERFFFGDRDGARFFRNDDDDGVGRFAQAASGAVTRPELSIHFIVRREWQEAAGGIDALMSNDDGAVVRGIGFVGDEERHEELFCNLGIDFDALDHVLIEDGIFLDGDEGADSSLTEQ